MVDVDFSEFKPADDSQDDNGQLDLEQVKQIFVIDVAGIKGQEKIQNTLWLSHISAQ